MLRPRRRAEWLYQLEGIGAGGNGKPLPFRAGNVAHSQPGYASRRADSVLPVLGRCDAKGAGHTPAKPRGSQAGWARTRTPQTSRTIPLAGVSRLPARPTFS